MMFPTNAIFIALPQQLGVPKPSLRNGKTCRVISNEELAEYSNIQKNIRVTDEDAKNIILLTYKESLKESMNGKLTLPVLAPQGRTAMYTGVSQNSIRRFLMTHEQEKKFGIRQKVGGHKNRGCKTILDDRDMIIIKRIIRDYYIKHAKVPPVRCLLFKLMNEIPTFLNNEALIYKVLQDIGFIRKRYYSKRNILIEKPDIISHRDNYLITIKKLRNETENIFYVYECIIDKSLTFFKSWCQKYNYNGALNDQNTFIFICVASKNGFLKKSALLRQNSIDQTVSHYGGQVSAQFFERWLNVYLIPNLPEKSVIIMDEAPHHCILKNNSINELSTKEEMMECLKRKNVVCNKYMRRSELCKLIEENKQDNEYIVDDLLRRNGHQTLRLPEFMTDLNVTQHAMDKIQLKIFEDINTKHQLFNLNSLLHLINGLMVEITEENWLEFNDRVVALEEDCWRKDGEVEDAIDQVLLNMRDLVYQNGDESDFQSESGDSE